jgi:hypothetical protein
VTGVVVQDIVRLDIQDAGSDLLIGPAAVGQP